MQIVLITAQPQVVVDWPLVPRIGDQVEMADGTQYRVQDVVWFVDYLQVGGALAPVAVFLTDVGV